ncbi:DUF309 domain-containing protein [Bacillus taeanensis]|uniref:DUF309 domain-containing protein n=1 Tax=Bacillus taeanensis TaxID=273032 RepID=A0A366Y0E0_9BACI|nr:DUF309 domain-containing protein [Bacillus taeanensis]RBW71308.1 DUF309 domain-containing protein [Bacillus taeanensis]
MSKFPYPIEYYEFFVQFNEGNYYTCHDLLEEIWMTNKSNLFLKGLLQMSVALYHYSYGNVKGARLMMNTAYRYLAPYRPSFWGIDVADCLEFIENCLLIIPQHIEMVPFEEVKELPLLPSLILYLNSNEKRN